MSGAPVWKRQKTARGTLAHCWGPYTIEQDGEVWWLFGNVGGLDRGIGDNPRHPSFQAAKDAAYQDAQR